MASIALRTTSQFVRRREEQDDRDVVAGCVDIPGSARLELVNGVGLLDPESAVFEAMLAGWAKEQRSRFLRDAATIEPRLAIVRRMASFTGLHPWQWQP